MHGMCHFTLYHPHNIKTITINSTSHIQNHHSLSQLKCQQHGILLVFIILTDFFQCYKFAYACVSSLTWQNHSPYLLKLPKQSKGVKIIPPELHDQTKFSGRKFSNDGQNSNGCRVHVGSNVPDIT